MKIKIYKCREKVAKAFAEYLYKLSKNEGGIHIALSGGSTPKMVFELLAAEYKDKIDWSKVYFYWGDERCVAPTDADSNYGMTAELLLSNIPVPSGNIFRIMGENAALEEAKRYSSLLEDQLPAYNHIPQFDLVILGMGNDGHTASIFPHEISLWYSEHNCVVAEHPESGQKRISISGKIINNAKAVIFLVTGSGKAEKVNEIVKKEGNYKLYPAALVAPVSTNLFWFLDDEASRKL